jgi:hypothetical protein
MLDKKETPTGDAGAVSQISAGRRYYFKSKSFFVSMKPPVCSL